MAQDKVFKTNSEYVAYIQCYHQDGFNPSYGVFLYSIIKLYTNSSKTQNFFIARYLFDIPYFILSKD